MAEKRGSLKGVRKRGFKTVGQTYCLELESVPLMLILSQHSCTWLTGWRGKSPLETMRLTAVYAVLCLCFARVVGQGQGASALSSFRSAGGGVGFTG